MIELRRFCYAPEGTFGRLLIGNQLMYSVERPWRDNRPFESCIPVGEYVLTLGRYHRGGYDAYELLDVPGRSLIKVHKGNIPEDLAGCIAPGAALGALHGKWAVLSSGAAFDRLMEAAQAQGADRIRIVNETPKGVVFKGL